ncbi:hypothetical protein A33M_1881 [Rhodovulum sp. PH10]|uniref:hypothetical protein n=1 Tax=Rhodovulum sp. PH10 TaxID=1187851 RepID=UPI00027C28C1|nr:hypothetical protein [Rhodovulum sp. PH10]EJW12598.1 hypothetical protein A33M_1881 [Rhodovulum sp. PH10]
MSGFPWVAPSRLDHIEIGSVSTTINRGERARVEWPNAPLTRHPRIRSDADLSPQAGRGGGVP